MLGPTVVLLAHQPRYLNMPLLPIAVCRALAISREVARVGGIQQAAACQGAEG